MLYLDSYPDEFCEKYAENICKKIELKENDINKTFWKSTFPESLKDGKINIEFWKDILTKPIPIICKEYPSVKRYYDIAFIASFSLDFVLEFTTSTNSRKTIREYYYIKYIRGTEEEKKYSLKENSNIYKNDEELKKYQTWLNNNILKQMNEEIKKIIDYAIIKKKDRYDIIEELNIKSCPYCNRHYISNFKIKNNDNQYVTADIDHFYPKSFFQLFALSLYNFVPACKICNSIIKGRQQVDLVYPYDGKKGSFVEFELTGKTGKYLMPNQLLGWDSDIELNLKSALMCEDEIEDQAEREIRFFKLNEQYEIHKEYAINILYKKAIYQNLSMINLYDEFIKNYHLDSKKIDFEKIIFDYDVKNENLLEKPLKKLFIDIYTKY